MRYLRARVKKTKIVLVSALMNRRVRAPGVGGLRAEGQFKSPCLGFWGFRVEGLGLLAAAHGSIAGEVTLNPKP